MSHQLWAEHHSHAASHHGVKAEAYHALSEAEADPTVKKTYQALGAHHEGEQSYHEEQASCHAKAAKAEVAAELSKTPPALPKGFTVAAPTPPGVTMVPRNGAFVPPAPAAEPNVPLQFKKLFTIEDQEPGAIG